MTFAVVAGEVALEVSPSFVRETCAGRAGLRRPCTFEFARASLREDLPALRDAYAPLRALAPESRWRAPRERVRSGLKLLPVKLCAVVRRAKGAKGARAARQSESVNTKMYTRARIENPFGPCGRA